MQILFTGFGAFPGMPWNPANAVSQAAARRAASLEVEAGFEELSVTFDAVERAACLLDGRAELIVHIGVAGSRDTVTVERRAVNWRSATPDAAGATVENPGKLVQDAEARVSTLPLGGLVDALTLRWRASRVELSDDAGEYVCNATLFHGLGKRTPRVFVHVPLLEESVAEELGEALGDAVVAWWAEAVSAGT
ncbi:MAG: pyroglutamyl-peptidase [Bradymonadia bacterium]|jgi:pyroglutamyl-peptidase